MFVNEKLQAEDLSGAVDAKMYRSLVGRLLYATHTRPDISYAVGILSRFVSSPSKLHFDAGKRVLRYLRGTQNYGIWYSRSSKCKLVGFSDSDWAGCAEDRKSTTGMIFNIRTGAVSWGSKKQDITALSTTEAEYVAASTAACQAVWLRRILEDCGMKQLGAMVV